MKRILYSNEKRKNTVIEVFDLSEKADKNANYYCIRRIVVNDKNRTDHNKWYT